MMVCFGNLARSRRAAQPGATPDGNLLQVNPPPD
jgi:hypothetical protein